MKGSEIIDALVSAAWTPCDDLNLYQRQEAAGMQYVFEHHYHKTLARRYAARIAEVAGFAPEPDAEMQLLAGPPCLGDRRA